MTRATVATAGDARPAFVVSAYRNPGQLVRLVSRLQGGGATFWVHVDAKAPGVRRSVEEAFRGRADVRLLPSHRCSWGDLGHVRASLKGIRALLAEGAPFDVAILLTGQCYPLKPRSEIDAFFRQRSAVSFIECTPFPVAGWRHDGYDRVERWHFWFGDRYFAFPGTEQFRAWYLERAWTEVLSRTGLGRLRRAAPFPEAFFGGSGYWCLSREAVEYVDDFVARRPDFVRFFRHVLCPDEIFFQTILMNSPLASKVVSDNLRYVDWSMPRTRSPKVLRSEDFGSLAASASLFARKFDEEVDAEVLDRIDGELLGIARLERPS